MGTAAAVTEVDVVAVVPAVAVAAIESDRHPSCHKDEYVACSLSNSFLLRNFVVLKRSVAPDTNQQSP